LSCFLSHWENAMPFIPVPDTIQLEFRCTLQGENVENTFYYLSPAPLDQALLDAVAEAARDYVDTFPDVFSTNWTFNEIYCRDLSSSTFLSALAPSAGGTVGTFTDPNPNNVTWALKRSSGFSGRSARGRIYWMGIAESMTTGTNVMDPTFANDVVAWVQAFDAAVAAEGVTPVIVSRYNAGAPRVTGVTYPIADWTYTDLRVDTMRGRLP